MTAGTVKVHTSAERDDSVVLMYPDNQLRDQVRSYDETQSAFSVIRSTFFNQL